MSARVRAINPAGVAAPLARYSHGVTYPASGRVLTTSGQLGVAADGSVPAGAEAQCVLIFEALGAILAEAGMGFPDVVKFTGFVTDRALFAVYGAVRARYVAGTAYASTLVVVSGFTRPEFLIEVELTAVR